MAQVISPLNSDIIISSERIEGEANFRKSLKTDIVVQGEDFNYIYGFEQRTVNRCVDIYLKVRGINCPFELKSLIKLNASRYSPNRCEATLKTTTIDSFQCFQTLLKKEFNIFNVPQRTTVQTSEGELEFVTSNQTVGFIATNTLYSQIALNANPSLTPVETVAGYTAIYNRQFNFNTAVPSMDVTTTWARETVTLPTGVQPIGSGWSLFAFAGLNAIWKRPVRRTYDASQSSSTATEVIVYYQVNGFQDGKLIPTEYSNGVKLKDILESMVSTCGMTVVSDFFNINRDFTFFINTAYDYAFDFLKDILVFQKSDITLPNASNDATRGVITLEKLLQLLSDLYNTKFTVINNVLRIEHVSYYQQTNGLDLTVAPYAQYIAGLGSYSYLENSIPTQENWLFQEQSDFVGTFDGYTIVYNDTCSNGDPKTYVLDLLNNNVSFITNFPNKVSERGFTFVSYVTNNGKDVIMSQNETNDVNGLFLIHENLWRYERPQQDFTMNQNAQTAISVIPIKRGDTVQIPLCCFDFNSFTGLQKVKTQLGWGTVESFEYSLKEDLLTIQLNY
jgi:hypothetical protein